MKIKVNLSKIMGEQKLKVSELSKRTHISRQALYKLYHERSERIEFETLAKLCQALDCTVGDLLEHVPDEQKK